MAPHGSLCACVHVHVHGCNARVGGGGGSGGSHCMTPPPPPMSTMAVFLMAALTGSPSSSSEDFVSEFEADFIWTDPAELDLASSLSVPGLAMHSLLEDAPQTTFSGSKCPRPSACFLLNVPGNSSQKQPITNEDGDGRELVRGSHARIDV